MYWHICGLSESYLFVANAFVIFHLNCGECKDALTDTVFIIVIFTAKDKVYLSVVSRRSSSWPVQMLQENAQALAY
jgi:hypothetical protein